jgi:arylsulfatase A-like enzyme
VKASRELPFFLFFHTYAVHDYAWNDPAYIDRFDPDCKSKAHEITLAWGFTDWLKYSEIPTEADRACVNRRYDAGIRTADDGLKKLVTLLDTLGLMENTVLLITSDHGEELLERGRVQHGFTLYEELTHVPLILRPPGGTVPQHIPDLVEVIDVFPTLLEYAGLPRPEKTQGVSLIRFLDPSDAGSPWKKTAFSEVDYQANKYALRTDTWKIIHNPVTGAEGACREFELYELASDPEEIRDLAGESRYFETLRKRVTLFRKNLEAFSASLKGKGQKVGDLDPALLNELRAQGYVK